MVSKTNSTGTKSKLQNRVSSKDDIGQVRSNGGDKTKKSSTIKSMVNAFNAMPLYAKTGVFLVATKDYRLKKQSEKLNHIHENIQERSQYATQNSVEFYMLQAEQKNLQKKQQKLQVAKQKHDKWHQAIGLVTQNLGMNLRMQANRPVAQAEGDTSGTRHGITYSSRANAARTMDIIDSAAMNMNNQMSSPSL